MRFLECLGQMFDRQPKSDGAIGDESRVDRTGSQVGTPGIGGAACCQPSGRNSDQEAKADPVHRKDQALAWLARNQGLAEVIHDCWDEHDARECELAP